MTEEGALFGPVDPDPRRTGRNRAGRERAGRDYGRERAGRERAGRERAGQDPPDELPPGHARRRDGTVVDVMATLAGRPGRPRDPEGMGADTWRPWP